ncbi:MAG: ABC transporter ATP-binding protein [Lachnospiraceae bacterium]|nr:ABC transporter ATP-binding protein [Lachnospiraceae bacterium]
MGNVLKLTDMSIQFGGLKAIDSLYLEVNKNEIVAIIGPNGAGKTTAFNCITGIYTPTSGAIEYLGSSIMNVSPEEITNKGIARTFQNIRLFKNLTVFENVLIAVHLRHQDNIFTSALRINYKVEQEMREEAKRLLESQDLYKYKDDIASSLPYGIQRRLEIARALATKPVLLLLDEPAAGMNPQETIELTNYIKKIRDEFGLTILLIEHHMDLVMNISDRIYVIDFGKLIAKGVPSEIQSNQKVIDAYLGVGENA